jgi:methylenetetrahydrofolate--tRNA-(uracil-5-)-methyltransferase
MNINFGIMPPLEQKVRNKKERYRMISERALSELEGIAGQLVPKPV